MYNVNETNTGESQCFLYKMKKIFVFILFPLLFLQCKENNSYQSNTTLKVKQHVINNLQNLSKELQIFENLVNQNGSETDLQNQFLKCRLLFKNTEWATEYYLPKSSKSLNGPALDQLDLDENKFLDFRF